MSMFRMMAMAAAMLMLGSDARAQFTDFSAQPRFSLGGGGGYFRVSYDNFDDYYGGRTSFSYGGHASFRLSTPYNLVVKARRFSRDHTFRTTQETFPLQWQEDWINFGLRYMAYNQDGFSNFFGFGFAFFNIVEKGGLSVFGREFSGEKKTNASGFFLDFGIHYPIIKRVAIFVELEITSAGISGKSGFEGSSVGGFYLGTGLAVFPF